MREPTRPTYVECFPCGGECHCQHPYHDGDAEMVALHLHCMDKHGLPFQRGPHSAEEYVRWREWHRESHEHMAGGDHPVTVSA